MWEWENVCRFNVNTVPAYLFVKGQGLREDYTRYNDLRPTQAQPTRAPGMSTMTDNSRPHTFFSGHSPNGHSITTVLYNKATSFCPGVLSQILQGFQCGILPTCKTRANGRMQTQGELLKPKT